MKYTAASLVAVASHLAGVAAHGGVLSYVFGGKTYQGFVPYNTAAGQVSIQREWDTYNPIQDVTSSMLSCNNNNTALASGAQLTATVAAGTAITAQWNQVWPHNTGPMLTYLAQCPGTTCDTANSMSLKWFKIDQAGLLSGFVGNGTWAAGKMIAQNSSWTSTIPATVPPGNYLIRFETIALHSMPAQNYPECAQLQITGNGNVPPPSSILVTFPGAYSQTDPGINIDLYSQDAQTQATYVIPGPPLYPGTGATSVPPAQTTTKPVQTSTPPPATTTKPPATTSVPPATTSAPTGATAPKYGQCGGQGWTGATVCAAGSTCTVSNQYYSQCL